MDTETLKQITRIADSLANISTILNFIATEGLVTLPDVPASDN